MLTSNTAPALSTVTTDARIMPAPQLIRLPEVKRRTGLSRSTIYKCERDGTFPRHVNFGPRYAAWVASDVDAWIAARIAESRAAA